VPTFSSTPRSQRDFEKLTDQDKARFQAVVRTQFVPDLGFGRYQPGLRVKSVQGAPGVFEMTWAPDGRATWQYGEEIRPGEPHVMWRRIGTHDVSNRP
jgi:hypothetical protein